MLCRVASVSTRRLHIDSTRSSDTINKSLNLIAAGSPTTKTASPEHMLPWLTKLARLRDASAH